MKDTEMKKTIDNGIDAAQYTTRKIILKFVIPILALSLLISVVSGGLGIFQRYVDVAVDHEIFKESTVYNEGVVDDLAKYKLEMIRTDDSIEKIAIAEMVVQRFANYDESKIETEDLKQFLQDCRNMTLEDY